MHGLFRYDGPLSQFFTRLFDCLWLSVLWVIGSLPLITVGASTTAMYHTVVKVFRRDEGKTWEEFWGAYRSNFKQSTVVWLILIPIYSVLIYSGYVAFQMYELGNVPDWVMIALLVAAALITMWALYLFPLLARFQNSTQQTLKNAMYIALSNFPKSLGLLLILVLTVALSLIPFFVLFIPAAGMLWSSYSLEKVFSRYIPAQEPEGKENEARE